VVIDGAWRKAIAGIDRHAGKAERQVHAGKAADTPSGKTHGKHGRKNERQGPDHECSSFRSIMAEQEAEEADQCSDRQVDQPRPVHERAFAEAEPILHQIEPALPVQKVPDLHEAHAVIIVGADIIDRTPGVFHDHDNADQNKAVDEGGWQETCQQLPNIADDSSPD